MQNNTAIWNKTELKIKKQARKMKLSRDKSKLFHLGFKKICTIRACEIHSDFNLWVNA